MSYVKYAGLSLTRLSINDLYINLVSTHTYLIVIIHNLLIYPLKTKFDKKLFK